MGQLVPLRLAFIVLANLLFFTFFGIFHNLFRGKTRWGSAR
jgi:hypothetical protein